MICRASLRDTNSSTSKPTTLRRLSSTLKSGMRLLDFDIQLLSIIPKSSGKLDFYFLVLIALFLLATSKKSSLRKKY